MIWFIAGWMFCGAFSILLLTQIDVFSEKLTSPSVKNKDRILNISTLIVYILGYISFTILSLIYIWQLLTKENK